MTRTDLASAVAESLPPRTTSACDVVVALGTLLAGVGYRIHNGDADTGETTRDESGPHWWFTWAAPGMAECESGQTCDTSLDALAAALRHWFANAAIPASRI